MKINYLKYLFFIAIIGFVACEDDESPSTITTYAVLTVNGDNPIMINKGDAYTDPGAIATIGKDETPVNVVGSADASTAGIYKITYSAVNAEGFSVFQDRIVIVMDTDPSAYNLEGLFSRSNGQPNNVTQLSDRKYMCDNAGGAFPGGDERNMVIEFYNTNDNRLYIPAQTNVSPSGINVGGNDSGFCPECQVTGPDNFQWGLSASAAYGTFTRTFSRQ